MKVLLEVFCASKHNRWLKSAKKIVTMQLSPQRPGLNHSKLSTFAFGCDEEGHLNLGTSFSPCVPFLLPTLFEVRAPD